MKIKNKLRRGFGLLFVVVLLFGGVSLFYMREIAKSSKTILKDNYETLNYTSKMQKILDENHLPLPSEATKQFAAQLAKEKNNITEKGEKEAVLALSSAFATITDPSADLLTRENAVIKAHQQLRTIEEINLDAVSKKHTEAQEEVQNAASYVTLAAAISFLLLFSFMVNLPDMISKPIRVFVQGLKEVSRKNYNHHLSFGPGDEFSELANEYNKMTALLEDTENNYLFEIQSEKVRLKTLIEQITAAVIGVKENEEILFINTAAAEILDLNKITSIGMMIPKISQQNQWMEQIFSTEEQEKEERIYRIKDQNYQLKKCEVIIPIYKNPADQIAPVPSRKNIGYLYMLSPHA
ncbi:PAS domain-containing protein [Pedobacter gandavensis]|uniref:PAS domain-containing protein n=1 Tax=Pedobacter gandavensis TaxID=2679963 RepID=UPI0029314570|nr:PAS domain-containing protein [Pedobacter gandavensis]